VSKWRQKLEGKQVIVRAPIRLIRYRADTCKYVVGGQAPGNVLLPSVVGYGSIGYKHNLSELRPIAFSCMHRGGPAAIALGKLSPSFILGPMEKHMSIYGPFLSVS
jgi:hypothetical protein